MKKNKKTSIILATCNRKNLAIQCVRSLYLTTRHLPIELILVVDGDKETVEIIENFLEDKITDEWNYKVDYSSTRRGAKDSWNIGLSISTGEIIVPTGDDQLFYPNWLDFALKTHESELGGYGMVALNDKIHNGTVLGTTVLYDRKFCIEHLGGVSIFPEYNHFYVDNEMNERAKLANSYAWCKESIVEHIHPDVGKRQRDNIDYERIVNKWMSMDHKIFIKRKAMGFPNDFKPMIK